MASHCWPLTAFDYACCHRPPPFLRHVRHHHRWSVIYCRGWSRSSGWFRNAIDMMRKLCFDGVAFGDVDQGRAASRFCGICRTKRSTAENCRQHSESPGSCKCCQKLDMRERGIECGLRGDVCWLGYFDKVKVVIIRLYINVNHIYLELRIQIPLLALNISQLLQMVSDILEREPPQRLGWLWFYSLGPLMYHTKDIFLI